MKACLRSPGCFVCGSVESNPRALDLAIFWNEEEHRTEIPFRADETWCGYKGVVHGGILSAITDDAMAWALRETWADWGFTGSLSVRFLRPVMAGIPYTAFGWAEERRGRKVATKAHILAEDGTIHVEAKALFVIPEKGE
ncbi:PaaI family thioesterase [Aminiphilus sp.]|jgi:uncharacterized protein (TIGR00369 family)|uniref:PaaI family thioesterase n=1 Tax=Aminiphilus sp. TaxID=1872488 RepID=UPI00262DDC59|nr:PaaI family thioesterase [Aminiphilus sp.]